VFAGAIPECHPTISPRMYHACMAPVSLAVILALSFLVKRRRLQRGCWNGVPGLLSPANFLEEDGSRGVAVAVFGILFTSLCQLVLDKDPLPFVSPSSPSTREYWKILALFYYPAFYFPLLACATARHRLGYLAGSLLAWGHCLVLLWQTAECPLAPKPPRIHGFVPVSLKIPGRGYYRKYLKAVLSKRCRMGSSMKIEESLWSRIRSYLCSYVYIPEEGFRIPLTLVVSVAMAVIAVYQVALLLLVAFVPNIQIVRAGMTKDVVVLLVQFGVVPSERPAVPGDMESELRTARHYLWSLEVCYICSLVLCCLLTCAALLRTLVTHRSNLKALYQGAVLDVFSKAQILRPSREAIVCWISFASFQAAFACLGLLIQQVIFFLCSVAFTFLVVIPLQAGTGSPLFGIIRNMWPFWLTLVLAVLLQHLLAHSQFLERHSLRKEITNRRALSVLAFLLFPTNVLVGVMAGVWRVVISGLYNAIHFGQLDISLLPRSAENFDPGFRTYCHYLRVEVTQCHPLVRAFCCLLLSPGHPEPPAPPRDTRLEEGLQLTHPECPAAGRAQPRRLRARWWVAYTLLHNPSLAASRKTALADPTANGTR
ncbi:STRA6 protein, partial [Orthonyx spaldingii]|nr:STRA6 protein [Orthonyx spaldingii]